MLRNDELPYFTDPHQWQCFLPSIDHCFHRKRSRFAGLVGAVEYGSVYQRSVIMRGLGIGPTRTAALRCGSYDLILQAAGAFDNTGRLLVCNEILPAVRQTALVGREFLLNWRGCEFTWQFLHIHLSGNLSYSAFCHRREYAVGELR